MTPGSMDQALDSEEGTVYDLFQAGLSRTHHVQELVVQFLLRLLSINSMNTFLQIRYMYSTIPVNTTSE